MRRRAWLLNGERERERERENGVIFDFRCQEEVGVLKRKLDKYKSREWMASSDEVLLEEIKTYKVRIDFSLSLSLSLSHHTPILMQLHFSSHITHTHTILGQAELSMLFHSKEGHRPH